MNAKSRRKRLKINKKLTSLTPGWRNSRIKGLDDRYDTSLLAVVNSDIHDMYTGWFKKKLTQNEINIKNTSDKNVSIQI